MNARDVRAPAAAARALLSIVALAACLSAPRALAHPVHASSAQADYNRATQRLEIALRLVAEDLLAALNAARERPLSFEKTPPAELDAALRAYAVEKFAVADSAGAAVALEWIGREFEPAAPDRPADEQTLWIYLEAALPHGVEGARLQHALLHEIFPRQQNTIRVRDGRRETTLAFDRDRRPKVVQFPR